MARRGAKPENWASASAEVRNKFGKELQKRRNELGFRQVDIEEKTGIKSNRVSDIENGRQASFGDEKLLILSEALDLTEFTLAHFNSKTLNAKYISRKNRTNRAAKSDFDTVLTRVRDSKDICWYEGYSHYNKIMKQRDCDLLIVFEYLSKDHSVLSPQEAMHLVIDVMEAAHVSLQPTILNARAKKLFLELDESYGGAKNSYFRHRYFHNLISCSEYSAARFLRTKPFSFGVDFRYDDEVEKTWTAFCALQDVHDDDIERSPFNLTSCKSYQIKSYIKARCYSPRIGLDRRSLYYADVVREMSASNRPALIYALETDLILFALGHDLYKKHSILSGYEKILSQNTLPHESGILDILRLSISLQENHDPEPIRAFLKKRSPRDTALLLQGHTGFILPEVWRSISENLDTVDASERPYVINALDLSD